MRITLFLDSDFLNNLSSAVGVWGNDPSRRNHQAVADFLNKLYDAGYDLAITDTVRDEVSGDISYNKDAAIKHYIDNNIGNKIKQYNTGIEAGADAGERSIVDAIKNQIPEGTPVHVATDDGKFDWSDNDVDPASRINTSQSLKNLLDSGHLTDAEYKSARDTLHSSPNRQPLSRFHSDIDLANRKLPGATNSLIDKLGNFLKDESGAVPAGYLDKLSKMGTALETLGHIGGALAAEVPPLKWSIGYHRMAIEKEAGDAQETAFGRTDHRQAA